MAKFRIPEQTFTVAPDGFARVRIEVLSDETAPMPEETKTDAEVSQETVQPEVSPETATTGETTAAQEEVNG